MNLKKIVTLALAGLVLAAGIPAVTELAKAQFTENAPNVELYMTDTGDNNPTLPQDCGAASQQFGWGSWVRDTINNDNADCARIRITNPSARYGNDFRLCFNLGSGHDETVRCTAWASEGGSAIPIRTSTYDWAIGYMQNWVEQRELAGGGYVENVRVGIQWYELPDRGSCGASGGMQWASQSQPTSNWTYGGTRDNDPGCARVALESTYVAPYGATFEGSNLANATLEPSRQYAASSGFRILMRNAGHTWESDGNPTREIGNCDDYEPGPDAGTCQSRKYFTSSNVKLQAIDTAGFDFGAAPARLSYEREVTYTHTSREVTFCNYTYPSGPGGSNNPQTVRADAPANPLGLAVANAAVREPVDPEFPTDPPCEPYQEWVETVVISPSEDIVTPAVGEFPMSFRTPAEAGTYSLRFKMVKTDGAAPGTDAQGFFGEEAVIPVTIAGGPSGPNFGMSCPVAELTVQAGQTASYAVGLASHNGFAGNVQVTPSGMPSGATSPGATIALAASSTASGIVPITTSSSTPNGTSTITFTASSAGVPNASCTSLLVVNGGNTGEEVPTFRIMPDNRQVDVGQNATYSARYDADGIGTAHTEVVVTADAAWTSASEVASSQGAGVYRGMQPGNGIIRATYGSMSDTATIDVTGTPPGSATLDVRPGYGSVAVGQSTNFDAFFDPDGTGPAQESNVTGDTEWSFVGSVARSEGNGRYAEPLLFKKTP